MTPEPEVDRSVPPVRPPDWTNEPNGAAPGVAPGAVVAPALDRSRLRLAALLEVLACSGFPTQLLIAGLLQVVGVHPFDARHQLSQAYVFAVTLGDTVLLVGLIVWFLKLHGERPGEVLFGTRPLLRETWAGLLQVPVAFLLAALVLLTLQMAAPSMHDVAKNPLEGMIGSSSQAWLFGLIAVVGGGVREEIQRAFVLHRFRQYLGGAWLGLVLFSAAFGLGHMVQGSDVAVTTAVLGAFWGVMYLRRGSVAAPMVSHAGFNALEIVRFVLVAK